MILLVVGLVAVIVVVLIAVFLSIRLGRGDEHDELDSRPSGRDRHRGQDERWREPDGRRVPSSVSRTAARGGRDAGYGSRGPARERDPRGYDGAARRPSRPHAPGYRTPAAARSAVAASAPARGRYDTGRSRRGTEDYPSADYPSMDLGPGTGHPTGDHPSVEFPVADRDAMPDSRRGAESRRKHAPAPANGKSRPRQRGKRDDDDDWPSTEWDKLSDEQYWAELSADKPLSSTARPGKTASTPTAAASVSGAAQAASATRRSRLAPERDLPRREEREPVTERLPVRGRQAPAAPVPPPRREPDPAAGRAHSEPRSVLDTGPRSVRDTGPLTARDAGRQARAERRRLDTGREAAPDRDRTMLTGMASAPPPIPGALEDDPLTSPSFSLKAVPSSDSRSYSNARKHAKATGGPAASGNGTGSGGYPVGDYADAGYAYHAAPPAALPPAPSADWYSPPAESQTPVYGNPYQQGGSGHGSAGYADSQATTGYPRYLADPLRVYTPPGYQSPSPYAEPASPAGYQLPATGTAPYGDGYQQHPYPAEAGYADGYAPGYDRGYESDPYAAGGYRPYPPQG